MPKVLSEITIYYINYHGYNDSRLQQTFSAGPGEFIKTEFDYMPSIEFNVEIHSHNIFRYKSNRTTEKKLTSKQRVFLKTP